MTKHTGKPDPVTDMFEEMGVKVVDMTPGRDVNQNQERSE